MALPSKIRFRLIETCSRLIRDYDKIPVLLDMALIDRSRITFEGDARTRWGNTIDFIDKSDEVDKLLNQLIRDNPGSREIQEIKDSIAQSSIQAMARHLKDIIYKGQCVLFLGPEALRCANDDRIINFQRYLSKQLALKVDGLGIFFDKTQDENLSYIIDRFESYKGFVVGDTEKFAKDVYDATQFIHNYANLSELNFPLVINTNPDLKFQAHIRSGKFISQYYNMTNSRIDHFPETINQPIVYNIYGSFDNIFSILFTEKEAVEFTKKAYEKNPPIPNEIKNIIKKSYGLFVGFDFKEWHLKILFDILDLKNKPGNYSITDITTNIHEYNREYYERQYNMTFIQNNIPSLLNMIK